MKVTPARLLCAISAPHTHQHPHLAVLKRLRPLERLGHKLVRRHIVALSVGMVLMIGGSAAAAYAHDQHAVPPALWDALAYFVHAIGAVPVLRHIEPIWAVLVHE